jgi:predicted acylesterase/phospholipase RssA
VSPIHRVLAIDGGGVRGIIPTRVLAALETLTERPVVELFDVMVGTSAGGMLVLGLSCGDGEGRPAFSAGSLGDFYRLHGETVFPRTSLTWPRSMKELREVFERASSSAAFLGFNPEVGNARHGPGGIDAAFRDQFGDRRLSEALGDVIVTAFDMQASEPVLFRSQEARHRPERDVLMRDVARATSAAPTFFPPARMDWAGEADRILIDGGVFAQNPALIGYLEAVLRAREAGERNPNIVVVSLGAGIPTRDGPLEYSDFIGRSWLRLAQDVFEAAMVGQSTLQSDFLGRLLGERYLRFDIDLRGGASYETDNVDPANLDALARLGDELVGERIGDLHDVAKLLTDV